MTAPPGAVFLSYASEDAEAARRICDALRAAGIEVWFDQSELRGGDVWDAAIRRQIKACTLFIPVISANTHSREEGYFRLEWKLAVDRSHLMSTTKAFLVPVVVDATSDNDEHVPDKFREVQWTRLPGGETPPAFALRVKCLLPGEHAADPGAPAHGGAAGASTPPPKPAQIAVWLLMGLLFAALGYIGVDKLFLSNNRPTPVPPTPSVREPATAAVNPHSIAVLPFTDLSEKKDQEYFSDGLAETLLDLLAKTPGLHVIARTSSFSFKGKSDDIPTIAQKLHVANLLEGSVRKAGNHLRVTTQLIRADNGEHLWSETYDRQMADVFQVQDDIAAAVVAALKLKLSPAQESGSHGTSNPDAYSQFLLGRQFLNQQTDQGYQHSLDALRKAIALDPHYAAAYAALAQAQFWVADKTADAGGYAQALAAADKAIALAPQEPDGYVARGTMRNLLTWDWAGGLADFDKAVTFDPGNASTQMGYGWMLSTLGRLKEASAALEKSVELDPLDPAAWLSLARIGLSTHDYPAARESIRRMLEIAPDSTRGLSYLGMLKLLENQPAEALAAFQKDGALVFRLSGTAMAEYTLGHARESQQALDELEAKLAASGAYQIAEAHAWRGEKDLAFKWLDRSAEQHDTGLSILTFDVLLESLRDDARYKALLRKLKLPG